jgi:pimeloyl-ACP methyl ester carboxylesterase
MLDHMPIDVPADAEPRDGAAPDGVGIFAGGGVRLRAYANTPDPVCTVVTFDYHRAPDEPSVPYGRQAIRKAGANQVHVTARRNHWYQSEKMPQAIAAARAFCRDTRVVTFGGSMGGFAAIQFARALRASLAIAVGPQFSLDPAKVPFETRWREEAAGLIFLHDTIGTVSTRCPVVLVYDPFHALDAAHARLIAARQQAVHLRVPFADHHPDRMLVEMGMLSQTLQDLLRDRFDPLAFARWRRSARRWNADYMANCAAALQRRAARRRAQAAG